MLSLSLRTGEATRLATCLLDHVLRFTCGDHSRVDPSRTCQALSRVRVATARCWHAPHWALVVDQRLRTPLTVVGVAVGAGALAGLQRIELSHILNRQLKIENTDVLCQRERAAR